MRRPWLTGLAITFLCSAPVLAAQDPSRFLLAPPAADRPVVVRLGFYLTDVNRIDLGDQQFEVEGILSLTWQDDRLAFDPSLEGVEEKIFQGNYQFSEVATGW